MEKFLEAIQSRINLLKNQLSYHPDDKERYRVGCIIEELKAVLAYLTDSNETFYEESKFYLNGRIQNLEKNKDAFDFDDWEYSHYKSIIIELTEILDNLSLLDDKYYLDSDLEETLEDA